MERQELEHKIELLEKENTRQRIRIIEMQGFLLSLQRQIDEFIQNTAFKDILDRENGD